MKRPGNRVVLNAAEGEWFSRNVLKQLTLLEAAQIPQLLEQTTYKVLSSLKEDAVAVEGMLKPAEDETLEEIQVELSLSKKQKKVFKSMLDKTLLALENKVLPEYERRGLEDYIFDTKFKIGLLKTMSRKFK